MLTCVVYPVALVSLLLENKKILSVPSPASSHLTGPVNVAPTNQSRRNTFLLPSLPLQTTAWRCSVRLKRNEAAQTQTSRTVHRDADLFGLSRCFSLPPPREQTRSRPSHLPHGPPHLVVKGGLGRGADGPLVPSERHPGPTGVLVLPRAVRARAGPRRAARAPGRNASISSCTPDSSSAAKCEKRARTSSAVAEISSSGSSATHRTSRCRCGR